jgi:BirA family biotin operon repressor/biotin-[acetyl-CoA-carboxylase] ligase
LPPPSASVFGNDPLDPAVLVRPGCLATLEHVAETDSTMERAREMARDATLPLPAAVVADRQSLGRGRRGARWWQPPGSLATSIVIACGGPNPQPAWSLACGVALAETIRLLEPAARAVVRWPNDVEVRGRKLAGILVETAGTGRAIFGVGVNTTGSTVEAPEALRSRLITLPDIGGRSLPRQRLLAAFVPRLLELLEAVATDPNVLVARYRPLCSLEGDLVTVYAADGSRSGICRGIAADGSLVLDTPIGRLHITSGSLTAPDDVWRGDAPT